MLPGSVVFVSAGIMTTPISCTCCMCPPTVYRTVRLRPSDCQRENGTEKGTGFFFRREASMRAGWR